MNDNKLTIIYLLVFVAVLILLRTIGTININNDELLGYVLIIYGLSLYYSSFIRKKKVSVFIGSGVFLLGVIFFIIGNFEFTESGQVILPALIFILAISSFMLYLSDTTNKTALVTAAIILAGAIGILAISINHVINNYFNNVLSIIEIYWPILVILIVVIILVNRELKEKVK